MMCWVAFFMISRTPVQAQSCSNPATATCPASASICSANNYLLSGSFGGSATSATWSSNGTGFFDNTAVGTGTFYAPSATDISNGSVILTITTNDPDGAGSCLPATASILLTIHRTPTVSISGYNGFCEGSSTPLTANTLYTNSLLWNTGSTSSTITVSTIGNYSVTATGAGGCTATASQSMVQNTIPAAPVISASGPTTFCQGNSVTLLSNYIDGNTWSNGVVGDGIIVTSGGTYSVTYTDPNGCSSTSSGTAVVVNTSTASISGSLGLCTGGTSTLLASSTPSAVSYLWSNNATTSNLTVFLTGTYTVTTTDVNGCTSSASVDVIDGSTFVANITNNCAFWLTGNPATLSATSNVAGTYSCLWSPGNLTGSTITVTSAGTYSVTMTNAYGCTQQTSYNLTGTPINGNFSIGTPSCGNFSSLTNALTHLNTFGMNGTVTLNIPANYTETAPSGGFQLNACGLASNLRSSAGQTLTIRKSGSGSNPILTAPVGTSTSTDGIVVITGADYVTIDGIDVQESQLNSTSTSRMEWGYAILKCSGDDGANEVTVRNCTVTLNTSYTSNVGIYIANHPPQSTTAFNTSTYTLTAQASRNKVNILSNNVMNCYNGIRLSANPNTVSTTGESLNDTLNIISNNTISGFGGSSATAAGIQVANNRNVTIRGNTIIAATGSSGSVYGINLPSGTWAYIKSNTVTIDATGFIFGIYTVCTGGTSSQPNILQVDSNRLVNFSNKGSSVCYGFNDVNSGGDGMLKSFSYNEFSGMTQTSTGGLYAFGISGTSLGGTLSVIGNTVSNNNWSACTGALYGINASNTSGNLTMSQNLIRNNILQQGPGAAYLLSPGACSYTTLENNQIRNNRRLVSSTSTSVGLTYGIYWAASNPNGALLSNNTVDSLYLTGVPGTLGSSVYGIYVSNTTPNTVFRNNSVSRLWSTGTTTGNQSIWGLYASPSGTNSIFRNNTLSTLYTTGVNGIIYGVQLVGSTTAGNTKQFSANTISNISAGGAAGNARGIYISGGTDWSIFNNAISRLTASQASPNSIGHQVLGIDVASSSAGNTYYIYNNSIYLTGSGSGANFGSSGIHTNQTPNVTLVNNLVINTITPGASGHSIAYRRSGSTLSTFQAASDNNLYYAGTPGSNRLIYGEGTSTLTNPKQTLSDYKSYVSPREAASVTTADTPFVAPATDSLLHIRPTSTSVIESGGKPYPSPALGTDIDGDTRSLTAPDIGADEGNFIYTPPQINSLSAQPAAGQCTATSHTITVTMSSSPSVSSASLNFAYNGVAGPAITMQNTSGTTWTGTIPAAVPINATVTWSVTVTASNGSSVTQVGTSYQDAYFSSAQNIVPIRCFGDSAVVTITANGGSTPYTGTGLFKVPAGNYTYTVTEAGGCTSTQTVSVSQPSAINLSSVKTDISCYGANTGSIDLTVSGGTNPYSYYWNNGATSQDLVQLNAGSYAVVVTDAVGCSAGSTILLTQPASPPAQPAMACYQTATFNSSTCSWDVTGQQPAVPSLACYQSASFNTTTCQWDITGQQPAIPSLACYQTASFNTTTCSWDVTGSFSLQTISPASSPVGATLLISGIGFTGINSVLFNGTPATTFTVQNDNNLEVVVPVNALSGFITLIKGNSCQVISSQSFQVLTDVTLHIKVYLEGFFNAGEMVPAMFNRGVSSDPNEVDTLFLQVADSADSYQIVETSKAIVDIHGDAMFTLSSERMGHSYYLGVNNSNTIETWSSMPVLLGSTTTYDFTDSSAKAFGDNQAEVTSGTWALFTGDLNSDGFIDSFDFGLYSDDNLNFAFGYYPSDFNGDGYVDSFDFNVFNNNNLLFVMSIHP